MPINVKKGQVAIIELPVRGRRAAPIPEEQILGVIKLLSEVRPGQGVAVGDYFDKRHQAQAHGKKLAEAIQASDPHYRDRLGLSVIPSDRKDGEDVAPFVVAIRKT